MDQQRPHRVYATQSNQALNGRCAVEKILDLRVGQDAHPVGARQRPPRLRSVHY